MACLIQRMGSMRARYLIGWTAMTLLLCGAAVPALGGGVVEELKLGILDHDVPDLWSGFRAEPDSVDINIEALLPPVRAFSGGHGPASTRGHDQHSRCDEPCLYRRSLAIRDAERRFLWAWHRRRRGQLQFEDPDLKALGSRVLFHIPIEIGYRFGAHSSLSAYFEHTSNAFIVEPNEGLDRLGIRYGYRF